MTSPWSEANEDAPYADLTDHVVIKDVASWAYGAFADVYRGEWTDPSSRVHKVAIKIFRLDTEEVENTRRRLNRETYLWHRFQHPNILPFLGVCRNIGPSHPSPALISPLCCPGDVEKYVKVNPKVNHMKFIVDIACGLQYLHTVLGAVHGDLKPSNVVIDGDTARLCDFGRSKILGSRGFTTGLAGSIRYMAPETAVEEKVTKESDIYALSVTILQVLTGKQPYYDLNEYSVSYHVIKGDRPKRSKYEGRALTDQLWSFLEKCWAQDPSSRMDIDAVVHELRHFTRLQSSS